jgi:hypothetical protein
VQVQRRAKTSEAPATMKRAPISSNRPAVTEQNGAECSRNETWLFAKGGECKCCLDEIGRARSVWVTRIGCQARALDRGFHVMAGFHFREHVHTVFRRDYDPCMLVRDARLLNYHHALDK